MAQKQESGGAAFHQGFALSIGAGADLPNTVDDAVALADILKDPERCAYLPAQVYTLTGESARRDHVLAALDGLAQSADPQSTVIIYFSGHGYQVTSSIGRFHFLMPYGYDVNKLSETAISGTEFADRLRAIPAQKLLILLDCCHAGGVGEAKAPGLELAKAPLPAEAQNLLAEGSGRVLIASSREDEYSYGGRPYSAFTLALIEALCGTGVAKRDGYVRVSDLALHAREVVPGRTGDKQHPILHFEQADNFVLAYYAGGEAQPKALPFVGQPEIEPEPGAWTRIDQLLVKTQQQFAYGDENIQLQFEDMHGGTITIGERTSTSFVPGDQGAKAEGTVCRACGARLRPRARFCHRCGTPAG